MMDTATATTYTTDINGCFHRANGQFASRTEIIEIRTWAATLKTAIDLTVQAWENVRTFVHACTVRNAKKFFTPETRLVKRARYRTVREREHARRVALWTKPLHG